MDSTEVVRILHTSDWHLGKEVIRESTIDMDRKMLEIVRKQTTRMNGIVESVLSMARRERANPQAIDLRMVAAEFAEEYRRSYALDADTRKAWSEPHGYHFRTKHVLLRQVLQDHEHALLIDTDTFFHQSPIELFRRMQPGTLLCNAVGGKYGVDQQCALYRNLAGPLQARGLAKDGMPLLNSGVIGLYRQDAGLLDQSIALMDEFYPLAPRAYTLEEFCLAVAAHDTLNVQECPDLIHHYWSRKQLFRAKIQAWLNKHGSDPLSTQAMADIAQVNTQLPRPPLLQRLHCKLLGLLLPARQRQFMRELAYGCHPYANEFDRACAQAWWEKALENVERRQGKPACANQLGQWFRHPGMRLALGRQLPIVKAHLEQRREG